MCGLYCLVASSIPSVVRTQSTLDEPVDDDDGFGLSSPPPAASGEDNLDSDPFATVDGGSTENAGAFDSFSNQQVEVKEEEAAALKSVIGVNIGVLGGNLVNESSSF